MTQPNRREFMGTVGTAAAGYYLAQSSPRAARAASPNDTIHVACIGTGGRCRFLMNSLVTIPGVKIAAVCDVWDKSLAAGKKLADAKAITTKEYRELLDRKDIDAVLIGAPDHWHTPMTIAACQAGKDIYVEKPLTHDVKEGAAVVEAQNKYQRIVQVGTQQRSMPQYQKAREFIQTGGLGKIHKIHLTWNRNHPRGRGEVNVDPKSVDWKAFLGNAPDQPFDAYRFRNWRWFWDFGGGIFTDLMVHKIDIAHWILGLDHPATATSIGNHFLNADLWETPDTVQTLLQYPDHALQAHFEGTFINARHGAMITFMGTEGAVYVDRGRFEFLPDRYSKQSPIEMIVSEGRRGQDHYHGSDGERRHLANWLDCIRTREKPVAPAEAGVSAANVAHLANHALRQNRIAKWEEFAG